MERDPQQRRVRVRRERLGQSGQPGVAADHSARAAPSPQPHAASAVLRLPRTVVTSHRARTLGAVHLEGHRWRFTVWAPFSPRVELVLEKEAGDRAVVMDPGADGYHA